ncbi:hypothetical protein HOY82DRAFT_385940 [Tuber indicum]|nr:hypothetical protein HOY82DRAFT_385940 [Tuber indicum]
MDRYSTRHPSVPTVEDRLIVRLHTPTALTHTPTHSISAVWGGKGGRRKRVRVRWSGEPYGTYPCIRRLYSVILCLGASFPFLLSPNCPRTAVRLPSWIANCVMFLLVAVRAIYPCHPFITRLKPMKR